MMAFPLLGKQSLRLSTSLGSSTLSTTNKKFVYSWSSLCRICRYKAFISVCCAIFKSFESSIRLSSRFLPSISLTNEKSLSWSLAYCRASAVLPTPPKPVIAIRFPSEQMALRAASSFARPVKYLVGYCVSCKMPALGMAL